MIFVTVGTHEQQFNRLIKEVDNLKRDGIITDDVIMQTGYSDYEPKYCQWSKLISYEEMNNYYEQADIIITHGGPASFMKALELKKIPIVVPRQKKFNEHINDHQVEFVEFVSSRLHNIIPVFDISYLKNEINSYRNIDNDKLKSNNDEFNKDLTNLIKNFYKEDGI